MKATKAAVLHNANIRAMLKEDCKKKGIIVTSFELKRITENYFNSFCWIDGIAIWKETCQDLNSTKTRSRWGP